jgi:hypothetical protein
MDFANAFPWISEMILNFCKWILNFWKCISKNFGNAFPRILEMDFQFWEMDFQDFGNAFSIFGNAFSIF